MLLISQDAEFNPYSMMALSFSSAWVRIVPIAYCIIYSGASRYLPDALLEQTLLLFLVSCRHSFNAACRNRTFVFSLTNLFSHYEEEIV